MTLSCFPQAQSNRRAKKALLYRHCVLCKYFERTKWKSGVIVKSDRVIACMFTIEQIEIWQKERFTSIIVDCINSLNFINRTFM